MIVGTGVERESYNIHRSLLRSSSPVFEAMINGPFREGKQNVIRLPDDSSNAFAVFAHWLYSGELPEESEDDSGASLLQVHLEAFVFGDKYGLLTFKQMNYKRVLVVLKGYFWPPVEFIELLYSYYGVTSKIQNYFVDHFTYVVSNSRALPTDVEWFKEVGGCVPEFALAVATAMVERRMMHRPSPEDNSGYEFCDPPKRYIKAGGRKRAAVSLKS